VIEYLLKSDFDTCRFITASFRNIYPNEYIRQIGQA